MTDELEVGLLDEEALLIVARQIESQHIDTEEGMRGFRQTHPHLRFTLCSEDDMGVREPFRSFSYFDLYLVAHCTGGCSSLTDDVAQCSGLVIALHEE